MTQSSHVCTHTHQQLCQPGERGRCIVRLQIAVAGAYPVDGLGFMGEPPAFAWLAACVQA